MKNYSSKSSVSVKLITIGIVIVMGIVVFSIFSLNEKYGPISGIIISLIILSALIYFFANSLKK
jgi:predicted MFS family arabinose efflux permease